MDPCEQLQAILGDRVSRDHAARLLRDCSNDLVRCMLWAARVIPDCHSLACRSDLSSFIYVNSGLMAWVCLFVLMPSERCCRHAF